MSDSCDIYIDDPILIENNKVEIVCSICLCDTKYPIVILPCHHIFHESCIISWLLQSNMSSYTCPICRASHKKELCDLCGTNIFDNYYVFKCIHKYHHKCASSYTYCIKCVIEKEQRKESQPVITEQPRDYHRYDNCCNLKWCCLPCSLLYLLFFEDLLSDRD